jgi:hypothetical protein
MMSESATTEVVIIRAVQRESKRCSTLGELRSGIRSRLGLKRLPAGLNKKVPTYLRRFQALRAVTTNLSLAERLIRHRERKYIREAQRRFIPIGIDLEQLGFREVSLVEEAETDDGFKVALLRATGYTKYSKQKVFYRELTILAGQDDGGLWAVRVAGRCKSISQSINWLKPASVRRAEEEGRRVLRQGDVYIVESTVDCMHAVNLPVSHTWDSASRTLSHGQHAAIHVPFPAFVAIQSSIGGGVRRRGGD